MKIETFLSPDDTYMDIVAPDKARLLQDLSQRAASRLQLSAKRIADEILKREELGSTGMGAGIAIPHAQLAEIQKPFGLLAVLKRPIDFDAVDGAPVDLIFLLLQSSGGASELNALASVARKLREPDRLKRMREADSTAELFAEMIR